ncbi:ABC transporter substrate-binding protein [Rathayibacter sp. YIM 133350]|uniref:ABC transporter substrate-binding protein n=1 Tax=Rathayibacter sp. YIM 133350 TaxID=3131992 RepID=UPI00307CE407
MRRQTFQAVAGLSALTLLLAGCATSLKSSDSALSFSKDSGNDKTLNVMGFSNSDDVADTRLKRAEKDLDGVKVKLAEGDFDLQQFLSSVAAGDPPDLIYVNRNQIGSLAARGAVVPLADCVSEKKIETDQFRKPAVGQVTINGDLYGIPEFNQVEVTMANADLLNAAGLTLDDVNGSDWDAVSAANKALAKTGGGTVSVIGYDSKLPEFFPLWAHANGVDILSDDGKKSHLDDPKAVEALKWAVSIYNDQGGFSAVKAFRDSADFFGSGNQFATSTLGAMPMEQWYVNVLNDVSPDAPLAFDTVRDRQGDPLAYSSGSAWAVPAGSKNAASACAFAGDMVSVDSWMAAAENRQKTREADGKPFTGILTGNAVADDKIQDLVGNSAPEPWKSAIDAMYEANSHSFSLPANPADAEFTTIWQDAVNAVLTNGDDPKTSLEAAQKKAQKALDDAWAKVKG